MEIFPCFFNLSDSFLNEDIAKNYLKAFLESIEESANSNIYDTSKINEIISSANYLKKVELLSVLCDFYSIVKIQETISSPSNAERYLYAASYFFHQLEPEDRPNTLKKGNAAIQILNEELNKKSKFSHEILLSIGFYLSRIALTYDTTVIPDADFEIFSNLINNAAKSLKIGAELGDNSLKFYYIFFVNSILGASNHIKENQNLVSTFVNAIKIISKTFSSCYDDTINYVYLITQILIVFDSDKIPLEIQRELFCFLGKSASILLNALNCLFYDDNFDIFCRISAKFLQNEKIQQPDRKIYTKEFISKLYTPLVPQKTLLTLNTFNSMKPQIKYVDVETFSGIKASVLDSYPNLKRICQASTLFFKYQDEHLKSAFQLKYIQTIYDNNGENDLSPLMILICCHIPDILSIKFSTTEQELISSKIPDILLEFVAKCPNEPIEEIILSTMGYVWNKTLNTTILDKVFTAYENSIYTINLDKTINRYMLSFLESAISKGVNVVRVVDIGQRIANPIFILQTVYVNASNEGLSEILPRIEEVRIHHFSFIYAMLLEKEFFRILINSEFFIHSILHLTYEESISQFIFTFINKLILYDDSVQSKVDVIYTFLEKVMTSKNGDEKIPGITKTLLMSLIDAFSSNKAQISDKIFSTSIFANFVDYIIKMNDIDSMCDLIDLTAKFAQKDQVIFSEIDIFATFLPLTQSIQFNTNYTDVILRKCWAIIFGDNLTMDEIHPIKNGSPLPFIFQFSKQTEGGLLKFLIYIFKCCENDENSTWEVTSSDLPSSILKEVSLYRSATQLTPELEALLKLFAFLSSYSIKSKDLLMFFQNFTVIPGNLRPFFTKELTTTLLLQFQKPFDSSISFFNMSSENSQFELAPSKNISNLQEFTFFCDFELLSEKIPEDNIFFSIKSTEGSTIIFKFAERQINFEIKSKDASLATEKFNYIFLTKSWTHLAISYKNNSISLFVHGKEQQSIKTPKISFDGDISGSYVAKNVPCNIAQFAILKLQLSNQQISDIAALPRDIICTYNVSEMSSLPEKFQPLAAGEIYFSALYLYNACVTLGSQPLNIAPTATHDIAKFTGNVNKLPPPAKGNIRSIGGSKVFLPFLALTEKKINGCEDENFGEESLWIFMQVLSDYLRDSVQNQIEFYKAKFFEVASFLLSKLSISCITQTVVEQLQRLLLNITYTPLAISFIQNIMLDFRIWIYQPLNIIENVLNITADYIQKLPQSMKKTFSNKFTVSRLLTVMKAFLWSKKLDGISLVEKPKVNANTNQIEAERPQDTAQIRKAFWKLITSCMVLGWNDQEAFTLCMHASDPNDTIIASECITYLNSIIENGNYQPTMSFFTSSTLISFLDVLEKESNPKLLINYIKLLMSLNNFDPKLKEIFFAPFSFNEWLFMYMMSMNMGGASPEFCNIVFNQLFTTDTKIIEEPSVDYSQGLQDVSNLQFNSTQFLPMALMSVVFLNDEEVANAFMKKIESAVLKDSDAIFKIQNYDIPFIFFIMHKLPFTNTEIPLSANTAINILATLYANNIEDLERINAVCNLVGENLNHDYSHVTRLIFISILRSKILHTTSSVQKKLIDALFRVIFEYLFFVPNTSKFFNYEIEEPESKPTFQELYKALMGCSNAAKANLYYQTRTNNKFIWEDYELAELLLQAMETVKNVVFIHSSTALKFPHFYLIYGFTLSIGLEHKAHFELFSSHIRTLTNTFPTNAKLSGSHKQLWIMYMSGLIHTYLVTDRYHTSHLYLQEDSTSFSRNIYNNYGIRLRWGESIDSFDSCFKQYGHHFAYMILEEFAEIENQLIEYSKNLTKNYNKQALVIAGITEKLNKDFLAHQKIHKNNLAKLHMNLWQFSVNTKNNWYTASKMYSKIVQAMTIENGPWRSPEINPEEHFKLSNNIVAGNRRGILVGLSKFNDHKDASKARDHNKDKENDANELLKERARSEFRFTDVFNVGTENEEEAVSSFKSEYEDILLQIPAKLVTMKKVHSGRLFVTINSILYEASDAAKSIKIPISKIKSIFFRSYLLLDTAIEIFTEDFRAVFLDFSEGHRKMVIDSILSTNVSAEFIQQTKEDINPLIADAVNKWCNGKMSNFDYLMRINVLAGRSYNDLSQYPIFPWVIQDYTSEKLDLNRLETYRDLTIPIGAINKQRLNWCNERLEFYKDDPLHAFQYSSLYSSSATVIGYLIRMEPFTSLHIALQSGRFDHAERLFHNIAEAWNSVTHSQMDYKELIPEFFYLPDFLVNKNSFDLGKSSVSSPTGDVVLPPWAKNANDFIVKNRQALESPYVTAKLHSWIDMIFGITSRGPKALEINNLYDPQFFEEIITNQVKADRERLHFLQEYVACFGQGARKLFTERHPMKRMIMPPFTPCPRSIQVLLELGGRNSIVYIDHQTSSFVRTLSSSLLYTTYNIKTQAKKSSQIDMLCDFRNEDYEKVRSMVSISAEYIVWSMPWDNGFVMTKIDPFANVQVFRAHNNHITSVATSKNIVMTGSSDTSAILWYRDSFSIAYKHESPVTAVSICEDTNIAISCSRDGTIAATVAATGHHIRAIHEDHGVPSFCRALIGGAVFVCFKGSDEATLSLYDGNLNIISGFSIKAKIDAVNIFEWTDGTYFAVVGINSSGLMIIHMPSLEVVWKEENVDFAVSSIDFIYETNTVLFGTQNGKLLSLDLF